MGETSREGLHLNTASIYSPRPVPSEALTCLGGVRAGLWLSLSIRLLLLVAFQLAGLCRAMQGRHCPLLGVLTLLRVLQTQAPAHGVSLCREQPTSSSSAPGLLLPTHPLPAALRAQGLAGNGSGTIGGHGWGEAEHGDETVAQESDTRFTPYPWWLPACDCLIGAFILLLLQFLIVRPVGG